MKQKFEVGDKVRAWGVEGVVIEIMKNEYYPVVIRFDRDGGRAVTENFSLNGREYEWHKEPSLFLVEKAKKEEPIIQWYSVTVWIKGERAPCIYSYLYSGKEHFLTALGTKEDKFNWIKLTPVCKTQGNKLVEVE